MRDWWTKTAWPWLRQNWYWVPILPIIGLIYLAARVLDRLDDAQRINATGELDSVSQQEHQRRVLELESEKHVLQLSMAQLQAEHAARERELEARLSEQSRLLVEDPEKLNEALHKVEYRKESP